MKSILLIACMAFTTTALAQAEPQEISRVNGSISAEAGQTYGKLSTVNGSISIQAGATAGPVSTVNGAIAVAENARVESLKTTNGAIRARDAIEVAGTVTAVNGSIGFGPGSRIEGDVRTVNGAITLEGTEVTGGITTVSGNITLGPDTQLHGDIEVKEARRRLISWGSRESNMPRVVIGPGSEVRGRMEFKREVALYVHETARIGEVEGADPIAFSGDRP